MLTKLEITYFYYRNEVYKSNDRFELNFKNIQTVIKKSTNLQIFSKYPVPPVNIHY